MSPLNPQRMEKEIPIIIMSSDDVLTAFQYGERARREWEGVPLLQSLVFQVSDVSDAMPTTPLAV